MALQKKLFNNSGLGSILFAYPIHSECASALISRNSIEL